MCFSNRSSIIARKLKPNTWSYKLGIKEHLPLITKLSDMYEDIVTKCLAFDKDDGRQFETWAKKRQIRVATMCSGTESPILALKGLTKCMLPSLPFLLIVLTTFRSLRQGCYIERRACIQRGD